MGLIVDSLQGGRRKRALLLATFWGVIYDLTINHLPFGFYPLFWIIATVLAEGLHSFLFLGKIVEMFILTLFFAITVQVGEAIYMGHPIFFYDKIFFEAILAVFVFRWSEVALRQWKFFRKRRAKIV